VPKATDILEMLSIKENKQLLQQLVEEVQGLRRQIGDLKESRITSVFQERLYKILDEGLQAGFYIVQGGTFRFVNDHAAKYWGYNKEKLLGLNSMNFVHSEDREWVRENAIKMLKGDRSSPYEFRTTEADGNPRWMMETVAPIEYDGERAVLGISLDITEQIEARNRLAKMEALEASLLEAIPNAVIGLHEDRIIFANEGIQTVFGWKPEEVVGKMPCMFYRSAQESEETSMQLRFALERGKQFMAEVTCRRKDGSDVECTIRASRVGDDKKEKTIVITYEDITDRKQAEQAYRTMARSSVAGLYVVKDGKFLFVNRHAAKYAGYSQRELVGKKSISLVHPDDREKVRENTMRMLRNNSYAPYEFRVITKSGAIRWIMEAVTLIPYEGTRAVLGNSMDITELMEAQKKVAELKALETSFLEAIPHAVIGLQERRIIFANDGVESVFGWKANELIGQSVVVLYRNESERREIAKRLYSTLKRQRTFSTEFPCRRKDGRDIECLISASRIGDSLKHRNIVITYEDITESKRAKYELEKSRKQLRNLSAHLESAREEERTRIARELHDELGQMLTALNMDIVMLNKKIPCDNAYLREKTDSMASLVSMTMQTLKKIYMDLRPGMLDHLGLTAAMGWQAEEFEKRTGIECDISFIPEDFEVHPDLSTAIFRIFQETLTNVSRHADATAVTINLRNRNGGIELMVKDNGRGISDDQLSKPDSYGLIGIAERAYHWGGNVSIAGRKNQGTTVKVSIPFHGKEGT
jgi:PAS domain S-box-containing protein